MDANLKDVWYWIVAVDILVVLIAWAFYAGKIIW